MPPDNFLEAAELPRTSLVSEVLFPLPAHRRTPMGILTWWESRRLVFNVIVGATGLVSLGVMTLISLIPPGIPRILPPWQVILVYGAMANVCYTFGPMVEIALQRVWREKVLPVGPVLFRHGISFSVGLTLLPIFIASAVWVARLGMAIFSGPAQ